MRELLMPIDQTGGAWAPIEFALGLARRSGGRVIAGFHPRLETLPVVDAMGGGAIVLSEQSESRAETARAAEKGVKAPRLRPWGGTFSAPLNSFPSAFLSFPPSLLQITFFLHCDIQFGLE